MDGKPGIRKDYQARYELNQELAREGNRQCARCNQILPIKQFHMRKPGIPSSTCKECHKAQGRASRDRNPELYASAVRRWQQANPDKLRASKRGTHLKAYGLTRGKYDEMLAAQGGVCAVCGDPPGARRLHVDHDHQSNKVRALLCSGCNTALGQLKEDPERIAKLLAYIQRYKE